MKLSFSTLGSPNYNVDQVIDIAVKSGYHGVEFRAVSGTVDIHELSEFNGSGLLETAKKIKDAGLEVSCVGTGVRFCKADRAEQEKHLEAARANMTIAKALDCRYIRTFGGPLVTTQGYTESMKWIWEGYAKLCELGSRMGVMPLIETHDDFSTSARVKDILSGIPGAEIGVLWDILHPLRYGEAIQDTAAAFDGLIGHVHIKDSTVFNEKGFDIELLGEGIVPVADCIALLKSGGYDGYLSFEWEKFWNPDIPEPEVAIPHYVKAMAKYL
jgi:sugar phosphate isomerase/epimerase